MYELSQERGLRRFIPDQVYGDEAEAARVLSFLIAQYDEAARPEARVYVQAVELATTGELIGHIGLSPAHDEIEIGYAIAEAHQGSGYATELVRETARWALIDLALPSILGVVDADNLASIRVLEKAGFAFLHQHERTLHGRQALVRYYRASRALATARSS